VHAILHRECRFAEDVGFRVPAYRDVIDVGAGDGANLEALPDCFSGETGPVLDAPEAFFFYCNNQLAIAEKNRRSIGVIRIYS
jgi:hypothetical protein